MGRVRRSRGLIPAAAVLMLALAGCPASDLRNYISSIVRNAQMTPSITLVDIAAAGDSFTMGDGFCGPNAVETISYDYTISKHEITKAQFGQFIAAGGYRTESCWTPSGWDRKKLRGWVCPSGWTDEDFDSSEPIVGVSWCEAVAFCNWRSVRDGLAPAYDSKGLARLDASGYRLPTEVEWEYAAAKGGSGLAERIYAFGDSWDSSMAVCSVPPSSARGPADVGSKSPAGDTPQSLVDMTGNVWEWCGDNWQADDDVVSGTDRYYFVDDSSRNVTSRGGGWNETFETGCRCANRRYSGTDWQSESLGFRVVRR
jgi:formylglycine-generating enzyme required for sulfatase activity